MYLSLETDLMKTVGYIQGGPLQIFTTRLTTNNESADVALGNAFVSVTDSYIMLKMSVSAAQKTHRVSITKTNCLLL